MMMNRAYHVVLVLLFIILLGIFLALIADIRINFTPSLPMGLYRLKVDTPLKRGDIVSVCLPKSIAEVGLSRHYLLSGACRHSHAIPVVKQLIALPGDTVLQTERGLVINGVFYHAPYQVFDRLGRPMQKPDVLSKHVTQGYWLYGSGNPTLSWDSRYYGGVQRQHIQGITVLLWSFWGDGLLDGYEPSSTSASLGNTGVANTSHKTLKYRENLELRQADTPYDSKSKHFLTTRSQHNVIPWLATRDVGLAELEI